MRSDHSDFARQEDPLAAIGASLAAAASRRSARLRRRRRGLAATAATAAMLLVTGAAVAVTGTSTGVSVVDRWVGHATDPRTSERPFYPGGRSAPRIDRSPGGGFSPVVEIPAPGGEMLVAAGYASRDGSICSVMLDSADTAKAPRGGRGCLGARLLRRELAERPARLGGGGGSPLPDPKVPLSVYFGVARGDVVGVTVGVRGKPPVEGVVSDAWRPPAWSGPPLRVFFAVMPAPKFDRMRSHGRPPPLHRWFPSEVRARLADGTVVDSSL
jgi:hypothetical protein